MHYSVILFSLFYILVFIGSAYNRQPHAHLMFERDSIHKLQKSAFPHFKHIFGSKTTCKQMIQIHSSGTLPFISVASLTIFFNEYLIHA